MFWDYLVILRILHNLLVPIFPHWCSTLNNPKINIKKIVKENWSSFSRSTCGGPALVSLTIEGYCIVLDLFFGCCWVTENKIVLIILGIVHGKLNQRICIGTRSWTVNSITINIEIKQETRAGNVPSRSLKFHNHREGSYKGLLLVESALLVLSYLRLC